ncbi:MAG: nucleotide exchange factor GrpE [Deltaproteobacteria bacterium]|nr:nucleotide exchange factor GrpE [Deltaproteobacteria bacterium]
MAEKKHGKLRADQDRPEASAEADSPQEATLEEKYEDLCRQVEQMQEDRLRVLAESENFKKRLAREKDEFCRFATSRVLEDMLPVIDNLELALQHSGSDKTCQGLAQGVRMTLDIFLDVLQRHGLERIAEAGCPFDPARHEAMGSQESKDLTPGCVAAVLQTGYILNGRLLRPARVMVSAECGREGKN